MPRFVFSVREYTSTTIHAGAIDFPGLEGARAHAVHLARNIRIGPQARSQEWAGWAVEVTNEQGELLLLVPFPYSLH